MTLSKLMDFNEKLICRIGELEKTVQDLRDEIIRLNTCDIENKSIINLQTGQINFMLDAIQTKDLHKYKESCF